MDKPMISVIMPAYNAELYIEEAIRSVMAQTYTNWELLVLDDGSKDNSCAITQRLAQEDKRVRLIVNEQNMGVAETRNRGFALCGGDFVALLDSDDIWLPEKLERQLAQLQSMGADFSCCAYSIVDARGEKVKDDYRVPLQIDFEGLLRENVICCSTALMRRELTQKFRFDEQYYHEDYVLWLQLLQNGYQCIGCDEILAKWRMISGSRSSDKLRSAKYRWQIYREYLGLPFFKSVAMFANYALAGLRKYKG